MKIPITVLQWICMGTGLIGGAYFSNASLQTHAVSKLGDSHHQMNHGALELQNDTLIPRIESLKLYKDPMHGWNLYVQVSNFKFTPEHASKKHIPGEGHAHLMINGKKVARLYGPWFHIDALQADDNEIVVSLHANSHATLTVGGLPISQRVIDKDFLMP